MGVIIIIPSVNYMIIYYLIRKANNQHYRTIYRIKRLKRKTFIRVNLLISDIIYTFAHDICVVQMIK